MRHLVWGLVLLLFVSCERDAPVQPDSIRTDLLTIWVFEDAAYFTTGSNVSSIYNEYKDDQLRLNEDGSLVYAEDLGLGTTRNGTWELDREEFWYQDIDGDDSVEVVNVLYLDIGEENDKEQYNWEITLSKNGTVLTGKEYKNNKTYTYSLQKKY